MILSFINIRKVPRDGKSCLIPLLMIRVSKSMVYRALSFKTYYSPGLRSKEIHILTVGGVPGISNFKSRASPP